MMPKDPMMLYSFINMKLRDCYPSLDELCADMAIDREELIETLASVGYEYDAVNNKFW